MTLLLHRGAQPITKEELDLIPLPEETSSYIPVSHYQFAHALETIGRDILHGFELAERSFGVARNGMQMFGIIRFKDPESKNFSLSVALRNSYDKSMTAGVATGLNVFCCDNLALKGDVVSMKKHTKNVRDALENVAISSLYKAVKNHRQIIEDGEKLAQIEMTDNQAYQTMGLLFGLEIISPRQLPVMLENWKKPKYDDFQPRNAWSLYNSATEALKSSPPISIINNHLELHKVFTEKGEAWER